MEENNSLKLFENKKVRLQWLNMLAETSSTEISKSKNKQGFEEAEDSVIRGGKIAKTAKEQIEKETGKRIVSSKNANEIKKLQN